MKESKEERRESMFYDIYTVHGRTIVRIRVYKDFLCLYFWKNNCIHESSDQ